MHQNTKKVFKFKAVEIWDAPLVSLKRKKIYVKKNAEIFKTN